MTVSMKGLPFILMSILVMKRCVRKPALTAKELKVILSLMK